MIEYLQKFLLGSLMLYSVYYLFLRNEKTFRFNRFYLLMLIPVSLAIPLITVQTNYIEIPTSTPLVWEMPMEQAVYTNVEQTSEIRPEAIQTNWNQVIFYLYLAVCVVLFMRFTLNLYKIRQFKRSGELIQLEGYQVCLKEDLKSSFTFLNTVYTNKAKYLAQLLPSSILEHERAHVRQKHSYDIILMEFLNVLLWFNPVIYLIKKSIKLNHEFLADEAVCSEESIMPDYQKTLINYSKLNSYNEPMMASRLTFGETKKRLKMMVKNTHKPTAWIKQSIGVAAIAAAVLALGNHKVIAREALENPNLSQTPVHADSMMLGQKVPPLVQISPATKVRYINKDGNSIEQEFGQMTKGEKTRFASPEAEGELWVQSFMDSNLNWRSYQKLLADARKLKNNELPNFFSRDISLKSQPDTLPEKAQFISPGPNSTVRFVTTKGDTIKKLFKDLSTSELERFRQNEANPAFFAPPVPRGVIPEDFAEMFSDEDEYGVWIDSNHVPNSELKKFKPEDMHHYTKSKLLPGAKYYGKQNYQVNFHTNKKNLSEGVWINILTIQKSDQKNNNQPAHDPQSQMPFVGFDTTQVEYFRVPTPGTQVKFIDNASKLIVDTWKNLTDEQKGLWFTNGNEGMIFNPPKALTKVSFSELDKIIKDVDAEVMLNGQIVNNSALNGMYPSDVYDFKKIESREGKNIYQLTTNDIFLAEQYLDSHWVSNVLYKKSQSQD